MRLFFYSFFMKSEDWTAISPVPGLKSAKNFLVSFLEYTEIIWSGQKNEMKMIQEI